MAESASNTLPRVPLLEAVILTVAAIFFALHFTHLTADFPNHSPWMDWSKYTDEGWYGDAAIRHFLLGRWNVPGDFNPAAALPVWPLLEVLVFCFTGVSLVAARTLTVGVFGGILLASYYLLRRWEKITSPPLQLVLPFYVPQDALRSNTVSADRSLIHTAGASLAPAISVLLLSVSPFCFVFTRIAILEPLLILLTLLALHAATWASTARLGPTLALGVLLPAMILTKTTAIFLLPAIFFLVYAASQYQVRRYLRILVPSCLIAAAIWSTYFFVVVRPHFLIDYRYLFSANAYTGITRGNALSVIGNTLLDFTWIGRLLCALAVAALIAMLSRPRRFLESQPLRVALLLWVLGYSAFLAYHNNIQPRYYLVPAVPLTLLVVLICEPALHRFRPVMSASGSLSGPPVFPTAVLLYLAAIALAEGKQTISYVLHPEYTLVNAARSIASVVREDPSHKPLLLSISGSDISLITGLPSICDDFGTLELTDRVRQYRPGWYAAWNQIDDDKMDALIPLYHPVRVAAFPAMDDPNRNLLILYRLDSKIPNVRPRSRHQLIPRPLVTNLGQQPSVTQLVH